MSSNERTYRIEVVAQGDHAVEWFDSPDAAMKAVNRNRALQIGELVIQDDTGAVLTDRQLATLVIQGQLEFSAAIE